MLVLALDTSSAAVTVALAEVDEDVLPRAQRAVVNAKGHGELLAPTIAACFADASAKPADIAAVVAGLGPGPYTGLRVGLVTAAAMADALGVPTYGVCSLDAIAPSAQDEGDLIVVTDARRKEVYWARYDADGKRSDGPHVDKPNDVPRVRDYAGAGVSLYPDIFGIALGDDYPDPVVLIAVARERIVSGAAAEALTPLYLRHPDAVVPGAPKQVSQ